MHKFLGSIATADVAFAVESPHLDGLFEEAATALFETMSDVPTVQPVNRTTVQLSAEAADQLLFDWLSELIYLKDRDYCLFSKFNVAVSRNKRCHLNAEVWGEKINPQKHNFKVDVKAVTYHMFYLKQEDGAWKARVVLDI